MSDTSETWWERWRVGYNATAAAVAALLVPWWLRVLHVAGDQYGGALLLIAAAAWADRRYGRWPTRALLILAVLGAFADTLVLAGALGWFMGVTW